MVPASPDHAPAARGPLRPFTPHQEQEMCCCSFSPQTVSMREPEIVLLFFLSANGTNARAAPQAHVSGRSGQAPGGPAQ